MRINRFFPLLLIIIISLFFRFYNFKEFHFWGGDEEVLTATIRHIIWDKSPTLLVQNANLGFGLGPFYHYFLTPFYWIFNFDLVKVQAVASLLGVATTILVYLSGKEIGGKRLGLISGFLYASSFFISIFDRRLVHLTLDPIMAAISLFALVKIANKKYNYLPLLSIPIGFSFHADASLVVLVIAIIYALIYFRIPLRNKYGLYALLILGVFLLPLVAAEVVYKGAVIKPMITSLLRRGESQSASNFFIYTPWEFTSVLGRVFLTPPSNYIEQHFFYSFDNPKPLFSPVTQYFIALLFIIGLFLILKKRNDRGYKVVWFLTLGFISGILIYSLLLKNNFYQHYYMIFYPVFIVFASIVILEVTNNHPKILYSTLAFYFFINLYSLLNSSVKYPLYRKIDLVEKSLGVVGTKKFALYSSGDPYIHGGGWTELYTLAGHYPAKSYWYEFWRWIYQAYSLFPGPIQEEDPEIVVSVYKQGDIVTAPGKKIEDYVYKDLTIEVLDNCRGSFSPTPLDKCK